ncbi:MAG: alpha-mannosidase [Bacteroidetes bacterium]|nr:alpha-mannosidase [Bacteroidota bacterium]
MQKPTLHLICNAHLDPVWQWRWEEGASEAVTTFAIAARLLREYPEFVFTHNESILYRWVQILDPSLFAEIQSLVREGRWCIGGGWDLQPDVNMPGTEAIIRHIAEGRRFFREHFGAAPRVAYNFDSFGHSGGLPQLLKQAGYSMYVHMRPEQKDLPLPSDLYRWQGVNGSEVAAYRIPFPAYNTFPGTAVERIQQAAEIALRLHRDTPVFWGMGDHGGGATKADLEQIRELIRRETRVTILHSSPERFYEAIKDHIPSAPVVRGDLQRVFTGCYTSMARLKRRMHTNLGEILQAEGARSASWWLRGQEFPADTLRDAWRDHLFNDFHDILPGSSIEPGELDALDLYGRSSETHRRIRLAAVAGFAPGKAEPIQIPLTVLNVNPGGAHLPVEVEYMIDHLPKFKGTWHARLFTLDGAEVPVQEEAAEMLLLVDQWRRKLCFSTPLPHVGAAHFRVEMHEGPCARQSAKPAVDHAINSSTGRVTSLKTGDGRELLAGELLRALVVTDDADSWGMERWHYHDIVGEFAPVPQALATVESGPVRTIREAVYEYGSSKIIARTLSYAAFPFLEFRLRIHWNEERMRLKLCVPTRIAASTALCEIPGGVLERPADGEEHTHGRWMLLEGPVDGKPASLAIVNNGQHGFDVSNGEVRLSVLRSVPYCYEHSFKLGEHPYRKVMDIGVHEIRLLVAGGDPQELLPGLATMADWLIAPPYALAHYPLGTGTPARQELLRLEPASLRLLACKQSWDGKALIVRIHETTGRGAKGTLRMLRPDVSIGLDLRPGEITTLRIEANGAWRTVSVIEEE